MSYHRIYIAKAHEVRFKAEANKSGLVNELLTEHYYGEAVEPDNIQLGSELQVISLQDLMNRRYVDDDQKDVA